MNTATRTISCPQCRAKLQTAAAPNKRVRCPKCRTAFQPTIGSPQVANGLHARAHAAAAAAAAPTTTKVACTSCRAKLVFKAVKPGAKFKCPKCGSVARLPTTIKGEQPRGAAHATAGKAPPLIVKPTPAKKPSSEHADSLAEADILNLLNAPEEERPSMRKAESVETAATKPESAKPTLAKVPSPRPQPEPVSTPTPATPARRSSDDDDDDDDEPRSLVSPKLLTTLIVLLVIGAGVLAWSYLTSDSGPVRAAIKGQVTIDGVPVASGSIHFTPIDAGAKSIASPVQPIENGTYDIPRELGPPVGMCKVVIHVQKKTGRTVPKTFMEREGERIDEVVEGAAPQFNVNSQLKFDVKSGSNVANFEVSAK